MFKTIFLMSLALSVFNSAFASVPGEQNMECHSPNSTLTRVYLDIWMVGHPMGGLTSFEGMMSVDGHKAIATPELELFDFKDFGFQGSTDDLSRLDYIIIVGGLLNIGLNVDVTTKLEHRTQAFGPQPAGNWISEPVVCRWVQ
jgi:hypothetical protein